jgi:hypothetical protein
VKKLHVIDTTGRHYAIKLPATLQVDNTEYSVTAENTHEDVLVQSLKTDAIVKITHEGGVSIYSTKHLIGFTFIDEQW